MLLALALLTVLHAAPAADSVAGTWQIKGDVMGNPLNEVCTITQEGSSLKGSCTSAASDKSYDLTGELKDGKITFRHGGDYQGEALTIVYTGTLDSPAEIKGTVDVQPYDVSGDFTAVPAPAKP
ncbi:MAG TPA: hypothetical protein VFL93_02750 [Longimicrobiaceae bacterium]|nr:hypothetical protein [Longimicrobiaceae bacterium]